MILSELLETLNLGDYIKTNYNLIDLDKPVTDNEKTIFQYILYNKIDIYSPLDLVSDNSTCSDYLKRFIKKRVIELVVSFRQYLPAIHNKNISGIHNQDKFNPLENGKDVNEAPIFSDKTTHSDIENYLSKVDYINNLKILKDWSKWVEQIVLNY